MSAPQQPVFNQPAQGKSRIVAGLLNYVWWLALLAMAVLTFMGKWIYEKDASGVPTV